MVWGWERILTLWNVGNVVNYCAIFIILPLGCSQCNFLGLLLNFCNFCFFCRQINSRENKIDAAFESLSFVTPQWMRKDCVRMRENFNPMKCRYCGKLLCHFYNIAPWMQPMQFFGVASEFLQFLFLLSSDQLKGK